MISTCWINIGTYFETKYFIEIEVKNSNFILILGMQDGKIVVFQNKD